MAESYEKRAREKRKQQRRREKAARKQTREPDPEVVEGEELTPQDFMDIGEDRDQS